MSARGIRTVAVVGAGLMGHGIAQEFAEHGRPVSLNDLSGRRLEQARSNIRRNLETLSMGARWDRIAARLTFTEDLRAAVQDADLVIEAITEDLDAKRRLFSDLERFCKADAILASNTSTFMPSQLAEGAERPGRMLVAHFFNPPYVVPLVEVVVGPATSEESVDAVRGILLEMGKNPVTLSKELPGFIANRLQAALLRECFAIVESGAASARDVDEVVRSSIGPRLGAAGPFEVLDTAGLDVWRAISEHLMPEIESSGEIPPGLARLVERGNYGLKTGRGVYEWTDESASDLHRRISRALRAGRRNSLDE